MLHYSKFVNTKAQKGLSQRQKNVQLPAFSRTEQETRMSQERKQELLAKAAEIAATQAANQSTQEAPRIHASVNLEEMQRQEELKKQDEDWLSFFMSKAPQEQIQVTEIEASMSFGSSNIADQEFLTTPPPESDKQSLICVASATFLQESFENSALSEHAASDCLNNIFEELIADDAVFKQNSNY